MAKVQSLEANADIRLTYTVEDVLVEDDSGRSILVDRVFVQYWYPVDEGTENPFDISIRGWRATASGRRDKRQTEREYVAWGWTRDEAFIRDELGIDYRTDFAKFWKVGA